VLSLKYLCSKIFDICLPYHEKGTAKKRRRREKKPKIEKKKFIMSGEKSEREEKMDKCSTGQKNPPLRKKGIKKRRIMDMCPRVSRAHFSKIISERVIMDACPRVSRTQLSTK
jgi:hypothetical protein